jgi:uncharacterized protein YutE (UPF0331/DUF86 family)
LKISIEIERLLREIHDSVKVEDSIRPLSVNVLIEKLREKGILDLEITDLVKRFWLFRNKIVHSVSFNVTDSELLSFTDIGLRIIKILKSIQVNLK